MITDSNLVLVHWLLSRPFYCSDSRPNPGNRVDAAFQKFWSANIAGRSRATVTDEILKSGVTFDDAYRRLKTGRTYTAQKTGIVKLSNKTKDGVEHFYALNVPANYDPAQRYQVRFQLHGGVGGRESISRAELANRRFRAPNRSMSFLMPGTTRRGGATIRC